ncbi:MAG: BtpA/SgcQ family protein [Sandaracinaceae bacterium]|nr:BtpA/SgcQ family protein [Sandaracinaceae bacterium]
MKVRGLIGVVHLRPMPSDPAHRGGGFERVLDAARRDAAALAEGGAAAMIVENFGSAPFPKGTPEQPTPAHQIAMLARAVDACLAFERPVGVNVLRNDAMAAIGIAAATGASFVRVNVHCGAYVTDQGVIEGRAFETLRYRAVLDARDVAILADVRVKHASPLAPVSIEAEVGDVLHRGMADAVVVTGAATGAPVDAEVLAAVRAAAVEAPVVIGSGLCPERAALAELADAAIVGTWLKHDGEVGRPVDPERVRRLVEALRFRGDP